MTTRTKTKPEVTYARLNPTIKESWMDWLVIGAFMPGRKHLRTALPGNMDRNPKHVADGLFCPLGILCHLFDPDEWKLTRNSRVFAYSGDMIYPPKYVLRMSNLCGPAMRKIQEMTDKDMATQHEVESFIDEYL